MLNDAARISRACFLTLLCISQQVSAGGDTWQYSIRSFQRNGDAFQLILDSVDGRAAFAKCRRLMVDGDYALLRWLISGGSELSQQHHREALAHVERYHAHKKTLLFGEMGSGLGQTEQTCRYRSRALVLTVSNAESAVLSFYHWP